MVEAVAKPQTGAEEVVWDLSVFYDDPDDPAIEGDMAEIDQRIAKFSDQYRGKVADLDGAAMRAALNEVESLLDMIYRVEEYAQLLYTTDTNNTQYGALVQKITEYTATVQQRLVFFELEWAALDDAAAAKVLDDPRIGKFRHYLEAERRYKPYILSEIEEQLLVEKSVTGRSAWVRFFQQLIGASRYEFDDEELTQPEILNKIHDPDREVRRKAAKSVTRTLSDYSMQLTYIFNVLAADKASDDKRRGYESWVSSRNLDNKVPDEVVDALVESVTSNYDIVARHYTLKRKLLGYDELMDYDRYAPLPVEDSDKLFRWDEARKIVLEAYGAFSPQVADIARRFFDEHWIHAALRPGKRSGAYSAGGPPSAHPFIFMSYNGRSSDIKTLAHELGHGVHQYLANENQGLLNASTPLTTAEMASTFGEMLVFTDLMNEEPDPEARLAMLSQKIEETFATIFRQTAMNRFEDGLHNARRNEGELTSERISDIWMETQKAMFQGSVTMTDDYRIWWSYIPHFLSTPGYVYAYAFGELLVLALFSIYQARGAEFVPAYLEVLKAGGSDWPEKILARVGVDLSDPTFWNQGLAILRDMVEQEEALARAVYPQKFA